MHTSVVANGRISLSRTPDLNDPPVKSGDPYGGTKVNYRYNKTILTNPTHPTNWQSNKVRRVFARADLARVADDQDHRVPAEEHFGDESVLVHRLHFPLAALRHLSIKV